MESIIQLIGNLIGDFNEWLKSIIAFDDNFYNIYNTYIVPLPELLKILGAALIAVFSFTGLIVFLKKMIKVIFIIAVVLIIVLALS